MPESLKESTKKKVLEMVSDLMETVKSFFLMVLINFAYEDKNEISDPVRRRLGP